MAQNQTLPLGSGLGAIRSPSLQGDANEAAFRRDASSGGLLGQLLSKYPTQQQAIDARKSAQSRISDILGGLMGGGASSSEPMFMPDESSGMNIDGSEPTQTPFYLGEAARDIGGQFVKDFRGAGRMVTDAERSILQGLFTGPNIKTGRDLYGGDFDVTGGSLNFDEEFGGTIPRATEDIIDFDVPPADFDGEMGEDLVVGGGEEAASDTETSTTTTPSDGIDRSNPNAMRALEESQAKKDASQSGVLGQLNGYQELIASSMKSYNDMMGLAPEEAKSIDDYKKQFSDATGIDISGEPDNKAALMAFGFALMQNKAGKGFKVGKMLSAVGEAGEAALPAMERARAEAKAAQIAAGKYALSSSKEDKNARATFIVDQTQRLQDRTNAIYAAELKRIEAMSDTKDKYRQERLLKQMKLKNDAEIEWMKLEGKYATDKYKLDHKTTQQPIESLKGLKYTVGKNQNGQTIFLFPKDDARKFGQALADVKEGKFALTGIETRLEKAIKDGEGRGGINTGLLKEWGEGVAQSFGFDFNQEPVFEKREVEIKDEQGNVIGKETREVFTGEYKTDERPLTEAAAIRDRVIAQFKRFLTQETGNGISNVDIQNIKNLLGGVDFLKNPQDALFRIKEAKKIFEQREDAITGQLNLFGDKKRYSTEEQYNETRQAISESIQSAFKNKENVEEAFGASVSRDPETGVLTYSFKNR